MSFFLGFPLSSRGFLSKGIRGSSWPRLEGVIDVLDRVLRAGAVGGGGSTWDGRRRSAKLCPNEPRSKVDLVLERVLGRVPVVGAGVWASALLLKPLPDLPGRGEGVSESLTFRGWSFAVLGPPGE